MSNNVYKNKNIYFKEAFMEIKDMQSVAKEIRKDIIEMIYRAKSGHPGGSLSITDIITVLYWKEMNIDPSNPKMPNRDRFILSKGHAAPALYGALMEKGYVDKKYVTELRKYGSPLQGHPDMKKLNGVEMSTGSLGQGLSAGNGMALASRIDNNPYRVYVALGDGELQEGQIWEALMYAAANKVDNIISTIDYNGRQIDGDTKDVLDLGDMRAKLEAFGWLVLEEKEGNDLEKVISILEKAKTETGKGKPVAILLHTEMGHGVDYMMGTHAWHGKAPNDEQLAKALEQNPETELKDY